MEKTIQSPDELVKKLSSLQSALAGTKSAGIDLSSGEDLAIALMNLISIEEHLYFTAMKTNKPVYLNLLSTVREIRKTWLREIVREPEGEVWCLSKHLLAASMRLIEVGTKYQSGQPDKAPLLFRHAFDLYSMFWGLNLGLLKKEQLSTTLKNDLATDSWNPSLAEELKDAEPAVHPSRLSLFVKKLIDCCKE